MPISSPVTTVPKALGLATQKGPRADPTPLPALCLSFPNTVNIDSQACHFLFNRECAAQLPKSLLQHACCHGATAVCSYCVSPAGSASKTKERKCFRKHSMGYYHNCTVACHLPTRGRELCQSSHAAVPEAPCKTTQLMPGFP